MGILKSPFFENLYAASIERARDGGSYFMAANACSNGETSPWIAGIYAATFCGQFVLSTLFRPSDFSSALQKLYLGKQGGLASNATVTMPVGIYTLASGGSVPLGIAMTLFGVANGVQALILNKRITFRNPQHQEFAMTACGLTMVGGFASLSKHVHMGMKAIVAIGSAGALFGAFRGLSSARKACANGVSYLADKAKIFMPSVVRSASFLQDPRARVILNDLLYGDMLVTAGWTGHAASDAHLWWQAASRALGFIGITRIATWDAKNKGLSSYLDLEAHGRRLYRLVQGLRKKPALKA